MSTISEDYFKVVSAQLENSFREGVINSIMSNYYSVQPISASLSYSFEPKKHEELSIKAVIYRDLKTIVNWSDGSKTIVECGINDEFDAEKGLAMAIVKKFMSYTKFDKALENAQYDYTVSRKERKLISKEDGKFPEF